MKWKKKINKGNEHMEFDDGGGLANELRGYAAIKKKTTNVGLTNTRHWRSIRGQIEEIDQSIDLLRYDLWYWLII